MEILSPAGNLNLVKSAIKAKSNAVYGGFKLWNARNNAINFTKEEYNYVIDLLHKNNIKFYLTLNNLTLDTELKDIIDYLSSKDIVLPDAFIVADIGLIRVLKKNFPQIPIHVSTQFGVHNISDLKMLEELEVERVILARETTLDELEKMKENTNLEIETFIWGSQCLSFSGLCFFGSLINGGTGNRGKCINLCRDHYCSSKEDGTLLYVSDMNCINLITRLKNIDSLKIEGRRRPPEEIENVIKEIKNGKTNGINAGYLYGEMQKDNHMINVINKRIKPICKADKLQNISEYDVFMKMENNELVSYCNSNESNAYYVYSELLSDYLVDKKNYSIEIKIVDNLMTEVSITNHKGENAVIIDTDVDKKLINIPELKEKIQQISNKDINIIRIKYIRPIDGKIYISNKLLKEVLEYFKNQTTVKKQNDNNSSFKGISKLYIQTEDLETVDHFINYPNIKIIFEITSLDDLKNIGNVTKKYKSKIIYRLPLFNWKSENLIEYYKLLENKEVMFTRYSQLYDCKNIKFKKKYADYTMYSWNKESLKYLLDNGISEFTASPELSVSQNVQVFSDNETQYIVAGRPALVYTRNCLKRALGCTQCDKDKINCKTLHNKSKNIDFLVSCKKDHREIYYKYPILNDYSKFNIEGNFRLLTYGLTKNEIEYFIMNANNKDYYKILKRKKEWKESYECNLLEGRN